LNAHNLTAKLPPAGHLEEPMEPTIKSGKHLAENADLSGSKFVDVNLANVEFDDGNLSGASFNNINLSGAKFHDINFSDVTFEAAQIGGTRFRHIGPPPDKAGKQARQRPVSFEDMQLCDSTFRNVDLSNVQIVQCNIQGMTIDGMPVTDLLEAYRKQQSR
jgi:RNA polymerase sigma-70 factor (ECF subfamily)